MAMLPGLLLQGFAPRSKATLIDDRSTWPTRAPSPRFPFAARGRGHLLKSTNAYFWKGCLKSINWRCIGQNELWRQFFKSTKEIAQKYKFGMSRAKRTFETIFQKYRGVLSKVQTAAPGLCLKSTNGRLPVIRRRAFGTLGRTGTLIPHALPICYSPSLNSRVMSNAQQRFGDTAQTYDRANSINPIAHKPSSGFPERCG